MMSRFLRVVNCMSIKPQEAVKLDQAPCRNDRFVDRNSLDSLGMKASAPGKSKELKIRRVRVIGKCS
jgi:hypothetical protein